MLGLDSPMGLLNNLRPVSWGLDTWEMQSVARRLLAFDTGLRLFLSSVSSF